MKKLAIFLGALSAIVLAPAAQAAQFLVNLSDTLNGVSIEAVLTTSDVLSTGTAGQQGYSITAITGTRNGVAISGVLPADAFGYFPLDNRLYVRDDTVLVNQDGIGFGVAGSGALHNIFLGSTPEAGPFLAEFVLSATGEGTQYFFDEVSISSAVPEPGSWAMLILGFGAIGGALRLGRRRAGAAPAHA